MASGMREEEAREMEAGEQTSMLERGQPSGTPWPRGVEATAWACLALVATVAALTLAAGTPGRRPPAPQHLVHSLAAGNEGCEDSPGASGSAWSDGTNGCEAYKGMSSFCGLYGDIDFIGEGTAREHCCACGGGRVAAAAPPTVPAQHTASVEQARSTKPAATLEGTTATSSVLSQTVGSGGDVARVDKGRLAPGAAAESTGGFTAGDASGPASAEPLPVVSSTTMANRKPSEKLECPSSQAAPPAFGPSPMGNASAYSKESANCLGDPSSGAGAVNGACFNAGARPGVLCKGERTGYQCPPDEPDVPGGMAFACMDWTFGSNAMKAAERSYSCRSGGNPVYFGVGTYGVSLETDQMGGLGMCVRMTIEGVDRDIIAQSINTGHDVAGNQFDLQIGAGGAGAFNTCAGGSDSMFPGPKKAWGHQYGGPDKKKECKLLPPYPRDSGPMKAAGDSLIELCEYGFDKGVFSNPSILSIERVACPAELVNLTQFRRVDGPDADATAGGAVVVRKARRLTQVKEHKCNTAPGVGLDWCQTRMMDCRKPSGAVKDNVVDKLVAPGLKLVQPCTADGYTRIDVQCGCYDCYC